MRGDADLTPYVPSLVFDWHQRFPGQSSREVAGSMAFVDLSGFTAMSERLGRLGKRGAEDVVEIISSTFSELLTVAYEMDGSLLKFGGDALLLFFPGEDSARRVCAAVHGMRSTLRRVGTIKTEAGVVRLGMSSGIHTGIFHMFLAGSSHKELIVLGPETTTCVHMEHAADRGEILISAATAEAIGERYVGAAKEGGRLLTSAPRPDKRSDIAGIQTLGADPATYVPNAIREHRRSGEFEAEHRTCSVAFIRFEGTDDLIRQHGSGAVSQRLDALMEGVQKSVDRYGLCFVTADVDADGGKIMLAAGAPVAHEDNEERMLRALDEIRALNHLFPLRIGVNRGPVFGGDVGPTYRRSYSVMGDTVNTAARVMMHAKPGAILATEPVLVRSALRFEVTELEPFGAKGKSHLLTAFQLGESRGVSSATGAAGELVGRDDELAQLFREISGGLAGSGSLVDVRGEPGIGKSRLLDEVLQASSFESVLLRCDRYMERTAYSTAKGVFRHILKLEREDEASLRGALESLSPDLVWRTPLIAALMGIPVEDDAHQMDQRIWTLQLQDAAYKVIDASGLAGCFVIDDAQWMDEGSLSLIQALAGRLKPHEIVFVLARRADTAPIKDASVIALVPIDESISIRLARLSANRPLLPADAHAIAERGRGNPSFIRALAESFDPDVGGEGLPDTLEASIAARIDGLPPLQRLVLRHVSVLGMSFSIDDVSAVVDSDESATELLRGLDELLQIEDGAVRFRQSLFRDSAYGHLPFRLRSRLHERAGKHIEASLPEPERAAPALATHFHEARDFARSWRYSKAAAESSSARYAFSDAAHHFRRAIAAVRSLQDVAPDLQIAVWIGLGDALRYTGRLAEAASAYAGARKIAEPRSAVTARLCLLDGDIRRRQGKVVAAVRWYRKGLRILDGIDLTDDEHKDRVRMQLAIGNLRHDQGRYQEAHNWFHQALRSAESWGDQAGVALACLWLQNVATDMRSDSGSSWGERAVALFKELGIAHMEAQARTGVAAHFKASGAWSQAVDLYETSRATLEELGDSMSAAAIANNVGEILSDQGRLADARASFEEALATFTAAGHAWVYPVKANLAWILVKEGKFDEAKPLFQEARTGLSSIGAATLVVEVDIRRASQLLLEGEAEACLEVVSQIDADGLPAFAPVILRLAGSAALVMGEHQSAIVSLVEAKNLAAAHEDLFEQAQAEAILSLAVRNQDEAAAWGESSRRIFEGIGVVALAVLPPGAGRQIREA